MIHTISGSNVRSDFSLLDSSAQGRVGFAFPPGGESVLVNGAVFKTVSETVRTGSGRFDSYTPPPGSVGGKLFFYKEFLT